MGILTASWELHVVHVTSSFSNCVVWVFQTWVHVTGKLDVMVTMVNSESSDLVRTPARVILLWSWVEHFTLPPPSLSIQVYKLHLQET